MPEKKKITERGQRGGPRERDKLGREGAGDCYFYCRFF